MLDISKIYDIQCVSLIFILLLHQVFFFQEIEIYICLLTSHWRVTEVAATRVTVKLLTLTRKLSERNGKRHQMSSKFFDLPVTKKKNQQIFRTAIQLSSSVYKTLKLESQLKYCYTWNKGRVGNLKKYRCKKWGKIAQVWKNHKVESDQEIFIRWSWMNEQNGEIITPHHSLGLQKTPTSSVCRQLWTPHPLKLHWSNTSCWTEQSTSSIQMGPWE